MTVEYEEKARELGRIMSKKGFSIVYGGSKYGFMGSISNEVHGGQVIGVICLEGLSKVRMS